jgi:hypothetical protein
MSIFPQKETFEYYPETKDKYGNITTDNAVTCSAHIERERTFGGDGSLISKGKIFTIEDITFKMDAKVVIDNVIYYINAVTKYIIPGYTYKVLEYV